MNINVHCIFESGKIPLSSSLATPESKIFHRTPSILSEKILALFYPKKYYSYFSRGEILLLFSVAIPEIKNTLSSDCFIRENTTAFYPVRKI
jgi:hypothetical protein